jgi:tetratricopeptide (TPR) repeat protein
MATPYREARLSPDPSSAWFARLAAESLEKGNVAEALRLCSEGTKRFSRYATGNLILGRCYEVLGRTVAAMVEYRRVLARFPDNRTVQMLVKRLEEREEAEFSTFAEDRARSLEPGTGSVTFDAYVSASKAEKDGSIEYLTKQLQEAKRIVPSGVEGPGEEERGGTGGAASRIVTATLAEIYASQGEFREAIDAYRRLQLQRPEETARYEKRLKELQELLRLQNMERE